MKYLTVWFLYYIGHLISKTFGITSSLYSTYNWLMIKSCELQDKWKVNGPWTEYYCQSRLEDRTPCKTQCNHCKEYYKPIQNQ